MGEVETPNCLAIFEEGGPHSRAGLRAKADRISEITPRWFPSATPAQKFFLFSSFLYEVLDLFGSESKNKNIFLAIGRIKIKC